MNFCFCIFAYGYTTDLSRIFQAFLYKLQQVSAASVASLASLPSVARDILKIMKKSTKSTKSPQKNIKTQSARVARLALGAYMMLFLIGQLFTFEKFPGLLESIGFGAMLATATAMALVVLELLAMPFLIGLDLPKKGRWLSLASCFGAMLVLSVVEIIAIRSEASIIFGATFELPGGSWSLLLIASLWVLLAWSSQIFQRWDRPLRAIVSKPKS